MQAIAKRALWARIGLCSFLLAALPTAAQEQAHDYDAELTALQEQYEQAQKAWMETYRAAETDEERAAIIADQPGGKFVPRFQSLADDAVGTEAAGSAWIWVLRLGRNESIELCRQAVEILVNDYIDSKTITELPALLRYSGPMYGAELCESGLRTLAADSAEPEVQAAAMYNLAAYLIDQPTATEAQREEATEILKRLALLHGQIQDSRGRTYTALVDGMLQGMELAPGKAAPEIEGQDLDGVAFKLSDYRGKVVLLDFWGHW